jgi:RNA polymerase sigma factor (sigma-70 family)
MVTGQMGYFLQQLRRAMLLRDGAGLTDGQLLNDYLGRGDQAALAALVYRHGPMVWGVCRRVLRDYHAAEDAFQATFLVLVRKAKTIAAPELLANWLYGVAHQTSLEAQTTIARRTARERQVTQMPEPALTEAVCYELRPLLDEELSRLPDLYRVAIVICDLEGMTRREAARQLGVPEGTLAARLARGRKMLRKRLARRGLAISATTLAVVLSRDAAAVAATLPAPLVTATVRALTAVGASVAGALPDHVVLLAEKTATGMSRAVLQPLPALVLGLGLLAGTGLAAYQFAGTEGQPDAARSSAAPAPGVSVSAPPPRPLLDEERLQGTWLVVASERNGEKDFDKKARAHDRLEFVGDRVTFWARGEPQLGRFALDATRTPRAIRIEFDSEMIRECIYELDGNRLRFSWTKFGDRPASFDTATGDFLNFLYTYEKKP